MVSNGITQVDDVKSESHAENLTQEVEELSDVTTLFSITVNGIGIASCRNDLKTKSSDAFLRTLSQLLDSISKIEAHPCP